MLAAIEPLAEQVELTPASLMDLARAETGLDDFGPDDFVERLDVYCTALRDEAGLSRLGQFNTQSQIVKSLRNRLLVEDLVARHPEVLDVADPRADRHLRAPAHRHHAPAQPDVGRSRAAVARRTGRASSRCSPTSEQPAPGRARPADRTHRDGPRSSWTRRCRTSSACTR